MVSLPPSVCSQNDLQFFPQGKKVFWHSSAHILGEAMERHYGGCLCYGPPIDSGYYYDMFLSDRLVIPRVCQVTILHFMHRQVSSNDFPQVETLCKSIVKEKQPFIRLEMKKEDLLEMFQVSICIFKVVRDTLYMIHIVYLYSTTSLSCVFSMNE